MVVVVVVLCVVAVLVIAFYALQARNRRRPQEEQEAAFRKEFAAAQRGQASEELKISVDDYRLPEDRMKAIGAECGFDFQGTVWAGRQGKKAVFKRQQGF